MKRNHERGKEKKRRGWEALDEVRWEEKRRSTADVIMKKVRLRKEEGAMRNFSD